jgi:serine/threonine-protein kinase
MSVTTPAAGTEVVRAGLYSQALHRFVRPLARHASSELALVYVEDGGRERPAVLKRLPAHLTTDVSAVARFRQEARIAEMLDHPNIVRVLEVVETPGEDYYTMEYVHGADMRRLMDVLAKQQRTLPLDCVLLATIELCRALDYAHHLPTPVVHSKLSPSKILVGIDGSIKVTGFSSALALKQPPRRARTESLYYASPERFSGMSTDARSDVFALGVLLYELTSGEHLFADRSNEKQIMAKIIRGDLPRPSEIRRAYPRELETIVMRALARDREDRYQSAAELQRDLETFLWSRWPTASTAVIAKLVAMEVPPEDFGEQPLAGTVVGDDTAENVIWLGPAEAKLPEPLAESSGSLRASRRSMQSDLAIPIAPQPVIDSDAIQTTLRPPFVPQPKTNAPPLPKPSRMPSSSSLPMVMPRPMPPTPHVTRSWTAALVIFVVAIVLGGGAGVFWTLRKTEHLPAALAPAAKPATVQMPVIEKPVEQPAPIVEPPPVEKSQRAKKTEKRTRDGAAPSDRR